jgi:tRNA(fMet)-specific endonuclease VapC
LKYLLDTNVVSEPLRAKPVASILRRLRRHQGETAIASIVWHELQYGCRRLPESRRRTAVEHYLEDVVLATLPILSYDHRAAEWHARERVRLEAAGSTPPFIDTQIAAVASVHDLVLVTRNEADFRSFHGVRVESWG